MKKLGLISITLTLLVSCVSTPATPFERRARLPIKYENGLSKGMENGLAILYMDMEYSGGSIQSIDNIPYVNYSGKIYIKPGERIIEFYGGKYVGNMLYSGKVSIKYNFETGKEYEATVLVDLEKSRINAIIEEIISNQ